MLVPSRYLLQRPVRCAASLPRLSPSKAVSFLLAFVLLSTFARRLVPTDILNGSIGYVPVLVVMCLVAALALRRARAAFAANAPAPTALAPPGEGERARRIGLVAADDLGSVCNVARVTIN
jgi:hypothetical protein